MEAMVFLQWTRHVSISPLKSHGRRHFLLWRHEIIFFSLPKIWCANAHSEHGLDDTSWYANFGACNIMCICEGCAWQYQTSFRAFLEAKCRWLPEFVGHRKLVLFDGCDVEFHTHYNQKVSGSACHTLMRIDSRRRTNTSKQTVKKLNNHSLPNQTRVRSLIRVGNSWAPSWPTRWDTILKADHATRRATSVWNTAHLKVSPTP